MLWPLRPGVSTPTARLVEASLCGSAFSCVPEDARTDRIDPPKESPAVRLRAPVNAPINQFLSIVFQASQNAGLVDG